MKLTIHNSFHESSHASLSAERIGAWGQVTRRWVTGGSVALLLTLAGCGGGGHDAEDKKALNFTGTVAVGDALQDVTVEASCADGSTGNSNPTDGQGYYQISFAGSLPCMLAVNNKKDGYLMRAIALKDGIVNVTPLTEAQYQLAAGSSAQWSSAGLTLSSAMNALGSPILTDPTTTAFKPDGTGLDKNILDLVRYSKAMNPSNATAPMSLVPLVSALSDPSCHMADAPTGEGSTLPTSTKMLICPKVQVSTQLNDEYLQDLFNEFLIQLDPGFNSLKESVHQGKMTPAIAEAIERSVTYAAGAMLKGIGGDRARRIGLSKEHVKIISNAFKKEALESNLISAIQLEWKPIEWVVTAFCDAIVETVQEIWLKKATALDAEGWELFTGASLEYGLKSYMLEVLVAQVVDCATDGCTTIASPLKNTALTTFGWVYTDLEAGFKLLGIRSEVVHSDAFAALQGTYNSQMISLNEMPSSDLISWVKSGMPAGIEAELDTVFVAEKEKARSTANSVVQGLSLVEAFSLRDMQLARLDRLQASFKAIVGICKKQAISEGEVGVSKCLNALGVQPSAPTSCVAPAVLKMGACIAGNTSVSSVTPTAVTNGSPTSFIITGQNLPLTAVMAIQDATCQAPTNNTTTGFTQVCTPGGTAGSKTVTVKTNTAANGGVVISDSFTVQVSGVPVPTPSLALDFDAASISAIGATGSNYTLITGKDNHPAIKFSGVGNPGSLRVPNTAAIQFTSGFSYDMWVRIDSDTGMDMWGGTKVGAGWGMSLLAKSHDRTGTALLMGWNTSTWLAGVGSDSTSVCTTLLENPVIPQGSWFRVTIAASATDGIQYYTNKTLIRTCPNARPDFSAMNTQDLFIGKFSDYWYPMNGAMQDLRIYKKALTTAEVQSLQ